ncbi:MAG: hypothetical protein ABII26_10435 [Pseudomonadota bacterium]
MKFGVIRHLKEYLRGLFLYGLIDEIYAEKRCLDHLFLLGLFGNFIGLPYLFNYYHLRLLPYQMRRFEPWRKRVLKERDFFDRIKD